MVPAAASRSFCGAGKGNVDGVHSRQRSDLTAVSVGVFARCAARHRTEIVDEMGLVVPAERDREVGEVDARVALDLQRRLLQPIAAQHPFDRRTDIAPEHPLRGSGTPRRKVHHLLDSVQLVIVAHTVDKCGQRLVTSGRILQCVRRSRRPDLRPPTRHCPRDALVRRTSRRRLARLVRSVRRRHAESVR